MSELVETRRLIGSYRWHLLSTASAIALIGATDCWIATAGAEGADVPTVWIELGGQLERQTAQGDVAQLPFVANYSSSPVFIPDSPLHVVRPPLYSNGGEAKISFDPEGSDWILSASMRYGRSPRRVAASGGRPPR